MFEIAEREAIYLWYYFVVQFEQIFRFWALGIVLGSVVSVFAKERIHALFAAIRETRLGAFGVIPASLLGIASPLCMYGTIPIAAAFSQQGMRDDWLAAFMMSSVLLNPQLLIYSAALGGAALAVRFFSCLVCGALAGLCVNLFWRGGGFFDFTGFAEGASRDTDPNPLVRLLKNIGRNIRATGPWFLLGMSMGAAAAFMITGPATKITNLGALKIVLGARSFTLYLLFVISFAMAAGALTNLFVR